MASFSVPREIVPEGALAALTKMALSAKELKEATKNINLNPTQAQRDAGNYAKGHISWQGFDIAIETPEGGIRSGKAPDGKPWSNTMAACYGYLKGGKLGADGDKVDVFISEKYLDNELVHIIDQVVPGTDTYDESKVLLGFPTAEIAKKTYLDSYQADWTGFQAITPVTLPDFKKWLEYGDHKKPFASQANKSWRKKAAGDHPERCRRCFEPWGDCTCGYPGPCACGGQVKEADFEYAFKMWHPTIFLFKEAKHKGPFTVAVDLDGTLAEDGHFKGTDKGPPPIGEPRHHARKWLRKFRAAGAKIIIWTVRGDRDEIQAWLDKHEVPYDHINYNPHQPEGSSQKLYANAYFDDRGIDARDLNAASEVLDRIEEHNKQSADIDDVSVHILFGPEDLLREIIAYNH